MLHFGTAPRWKTGVKIIQVKILISITIDIIESEATIVFENVVITLLILTVIVIIGIDLLVIIFNVFVIINILLLLFFFLRLMSVLKSFITQSLQQLQFRFSTVIMMMILEMILMMKV